MAEGKIDLIQLLTYIDPSVLNYQEWVNVGMALKHEGYTAFDWDVWSRNDTRYKVGECFKKWDTFNEASGSIVTGGTIYQMAKDNGYMPYSERESRELDWDDTISSDYQIIDKNWLEGKEIQEPINWNPKQELIKYLSTLFDGTENVGYVTDTWERDGKFMPTKGNYDRTASQLITALQNANEIQDVFGDYNEQAGAWIRFNPLDGQGVSNNNVTDYRYALVESDKMALDKQNAIIRELELPVACLVHSGKKSIHAIVRIDADNYEDYRKRVDYLYNICKRNGLVIDTQNRNPSRLSRMPGIIRNGHKQFLIDTNIGKDSWAEWHEWIEDLNDDLPDMESLTDSWDNLPELSPVLIDGVLRQGHKMLMAGPSKAGKSFALIELSIAIAEGGQWFGWNCTQGKVLYVNLELDRASCLHRFKDVYTQLGYNNQSVNNIDIWNLRGKSVPMDKLAPKLIRRAAKKNYIAVIIDPIYKVLTGDENSADQMAHFTNQFDKVATELGVSVIYCHHHSKGSQGNKKSMDRASGSGVFARDPDALIDLVELELTDAIVKQQENSAICQVHVQAIKRYNLSYFEQHVGQDDELSRKQMENHSSAALNRQQLDETRANVFQAIQQVKSRSAWRVEGTLREFAKFEPVNLWFNYPIHSIDRSGVLKNIVLEENKPAWQKAKEGRKSKEEKAKERRQKLETAFSGLNDGSQNISVKDLSEYMGVTEKTIINYVKEHENFSIQSGFIFEEKEEKNKYFS